MARVFRQLIELDGENCYKGENMRKIVTKRLSKLVGYKTSDKRQYETIKGFRLENNPAYDKPIAHPFEIIINSPTTSRARYQFAKRHGL